MDKLKGSMESLSAMQVTAETEGLDRQSKTLLQYVEVLAVILRDTITEYKGYSRKEVQEFIEAESIISTMEVSPGRTNTKVRGDNTEFIHLNEKISIFDLAFRAKNPLLSTEDIQINLHIDIEPQKTYTPGYPIEKRGVYYLARRLSSQLSLILQGTNYNCLFKCYSIFICRDDVPKKDRYSIQVYEITNTKNTAPDIVPKEYYDLMTLVVIKLGNEVYNGDEEDEGYELFRFLNAIMYPHKEDFMSTISEYIDYSDSEELWKEVTDLSTIEQIRYEGMVEKLTKELTEKLTKKVTEEVTDKVTEEVTEKVTEEVTDKVTKEITEKVTKEITEKVTEEITGKVREEGIQAVILDNLEEQIPREQILMKLQKHFNLTEEKSQKYYEKYAVKI